MIVWTKHVRGKEDAVMYDIVKLLKSDSMPKIEKNARSRYIFLSG